MVTASSVQNASTPAKNGRLNYTSGSSWCAGTSDTNPYLQIDLQTLHIICAVSTQGNSQANQWVKTYKLQFSMDGTTWKDYKEAGQVKVQCFLSNDNLNTNNLQTTCFTCISCSEKYVNIVLTNQNFLY